jgi:hypothetical protein
MKTYELSPKTVGVLDKAFLSHPAEQGQVERFEKINERLSQTGRFLCSVTPESAEQTLMIRCLQEAQFWAKEAISKNELGG